MKTTLLAISIVILHAAASAQCLVYEVPLSARVQQAEAVFEGKVIAKKSFWNKQHTYIYTANTVEVYKIFKGNFTATQTEIITPGGVIGNKAVVAEPADVGETPIARYAVCGRTCEPCGQERAEV